MAGKSNFVLLFSVLEWTIQQLSDLETEGWAFFICGVCASMVSLHLSLHGLARTAQGQERKASGET